MGGAQPHAHPVLGKALFDVALTIKVSCAHSCIRCAEATEGYRSEASESMRIGVSSAGDPQIELKEVVGAYMHAHSGKDLVVEIVRDLVAEVLQFGIE